MMLTFFLLESSLSNSLEYHIYPAPVLHTDCYITALTAPSAWLMAYKMTTSASNYTS